MPTPNIFRANGAIVCFEPGSYFRANTQSFFGHCPIISRTNIPNRLPNQHPHRILSQPPQHFSGQRPSSLSSPAYRAGYMPPQHPGPKARQLIPNATRGNVFQNEPRQPTGQCPNRFPSQHPHHFPGQRPSSLSSTACRAGYMPPQHPRPKARQLMPNTTREMFVKTNRVNQQANSPTVFRANPQLFFGPTAQQFI